jgi:hypothetical protein
MSKKPPNQRRKLQLIYRTLVIFTTGQEQRHFLRQAACEQALPALMNL